MIQPHEMKLELPITISNGVMSSTSHVWEILQASYEGDLETVKKLHKYCPELVYAQYNYAPPIHFAVREGHYDIVDFLLEQGAYNPGYKTYPFQDNLLIIANDREYDDIAGLLKKYSDKPPLHFFRGENGEIHYNRTPLEKHFEEAVDKEDIEDVGKLLKVNPELVHNETFFLAEGILMRPTNDHNLQMVELLMSYGAKVPMILKWTQAYYFKHLDIATYLMDNGMNPGVMSCHHVTILHDMAQKGFIDKANLLISHGADLNPIEEEYQSTPLVWQPDGGICLWFNTSWNKVQTLIKQAHPGQGHWHGPEKKGILR